MREVLVIAKKQRHVATDHPDKIFCIAVVSEYPSLSALAEYHHLVNYFFLCLSD